MRIPVYNGNPSHSVSHGGDIFYDANTGVIKWFDAANNSWKTVSSTIPEPSNVLINGNNTVTLEPNGETVFPGNILPANTLLYDLGSSSHRFRDLYLSGNTIYLGDAILTSTNGTFAVDGLTYASEDYVANSVAAVVDGAPLDLATLNKIANSINNNSDFYGWVNTELGLKSNTVDLATVATTGSYSDLTGTPNQELNSNSVVSFTSVIVTTVKTTPVLVSELPDPILAGAGTRAFVTDASTNVFGDLLVGLGTNQVPVYSDGTNWKIG